jgi:hypothetical protein
MRNPMQMEQFEANGVMQIQQHYLISNKQSLSYRMRWFKWRFVQYSQNFDIKIIKRRSSGANFIMQVLTTERCLCNLESNRSKLTSMFIKLCRSLSVVCLQYGEHWLPHSRQIWWSPSDHTSSQTYFERILRSRMGRLFLKSHAIKSDLIYLTFRIVHTREIC